MSGSAHSMNDASIGAVVARIRRSALSRRTGGTRRRLPPMRADEEELLGYSDWREANSRLACQIPFTDSLDGIAVTVAPED